MKLSLLISFLLTASAAFAQQGYVFRASDIQVTFPDKPAKDTSITQADQTIRVVVARDSISSYLLNTIGVANPSLANLADSSATDFMDGIMDGMRKSYNADVYFVKTVVVNSAKVREYDMKGRLGNRPITIKNWVWLKAGKAYVCQHFYLTDNEKLVLRRQHDYFQSLVF